MLLTATTELEAVNECLENIGNAPVSTISGNLGVDTQIALNFVRKVSRELQSAGWYWNSDYNYPLTPNVDGDIILPQNLLAIDSDGDDADRDVVWRGTRLYDRENRTHTFTSPIRVKMTRLFAFEELPETARRYIALRAARLFQDRIEGNEDAGDSADEAMAMAVLHADQLRVEDNNMLSGSFGMFRTLQRTRS